MTAEHTINRAASYDNVFLAPDHDKAERRAWASCAVHDHDGRRNDRRSAILIIGPDRGRAARPPGGYMCRRMPAPCCSPRWPTRMRASIPTIRASLSAPEFGDLAGYSSAIGLVVIALLIGYEAVSRFLNPKGHQFQRRHYDRRAGPCSQRCARGCCPAAIIMDPAAVMRMETKTCPCRRFFVCTPPICRVPSREDPGQPAKMLRNCRRSAYGTQTQAGGARRSPFNHRYQDSAVRLTYSMSAIVRAFPIRAIFSLPIVPEGFGRRYA
jgi:hypothetical protein